MEKNIIVRGRSIFIFQMILTIPTDTEYFSFEFSVHYSREETAKLLDIYIPEGSFWGKEVKDII